jgi:hypothetical protein
MRLSRNLCSYIRIIFIEDRQFVIFIDIIASCHSKVVRAIRNSDYISIYEIVKVNIDDLLAKIVGDKLDQSGKSSI